MMGTRPRHAYVYVYMVVPYLQGARISRFGLGHTTVYVYAYVYKKPQQPINPAGELDPCPNKTQRFGLISIAEMAAPSGTDKYGK